MGLLVKSIAFVVLSAVAVASSPAPAKTQDLFAGFVMARVCLPYATRAKTFEGAIRAARDMEFRRPSGDNAPLEDWASEVELVSKDGRWRLRIEEGTVTVGDADVYQVSCGVSSGNASANELARVVRLLLRGSPLWSQTPDQPWRWDRRTARPAEFGLHIDVTDTPGARPVLAARGSYY